MNTPQPPNPATGAAAPAPGFLFSVRKFLGRIRRLFVWDRFDVFRRPVAKSDLNFTNPEGYAFGLASPQEILNCSEMHTELDARERRLGAARIELGHACVVARVAGDTAAPIVFSMWINFRNINIPGHLKRRLPPDHSFIYKAFTSPAHRGRKLYESGMRFTLSELARRGHSTLLGYAHIQKSVSRKGLAALQFETIGVFRTIGLGAVAFTLCNRALNRTLPSVLSRSGLEADALRDSICKKGSQAPA